MNRRSLLAAPAALALGSVPALAETETPIERMFKEWERVEALEQQGYTDDLPDAAMKPIINERRRIEAAMLALPCECGEDWIRKISAVSCFGIFEAGDTEYWQLWAEARALVA